MLNMLHIWPLLESHMVIIKTTKWGRIFTRVIEIWCWNKFKAKNSRMDWYSASTRCLTGLNKNISAPSVLSILELCQRFLDNLININLKWWSRITKTNGSQRNSSTMAIHNHLTPRIKKQTLQTLKAIGSKLQGKRLSLRLRTKVNALLVTFSPQLPLWNLSKPLNSNRRLSNWVNNRS